MNKESESLVKLISALCLIPGLSGHEDEVRFFIQKKLKNINCSYKTDNFGNLFTTIKGNPNLPSIMIFAHMDQLGFIIKKIEDNGLLRIERLGGVPEKVLPSLDVIVKNDKNVWLEGVIGNKSHHATLPEEKYIVSSYRDLFIDCGFSSKKEAMNKGIIVGSPVIYKPSFKRMNKNKIAGTSIDDRAGCSIILELAKELKKIKNKPTIHLVFSVQEEFNLRGVLPIAKKLLPDIAIQLDIMLSSDTPDMNNVSDIKLGNGPCMSLYSFHGRGTLNGLIPHPKLVNLFSSIANKNKINLQRSAMTGLLTDSSYVQHIGEGIACIDLGFPVRYSHSPNEVCDLRDLILLKKLLINSVKNINKNFNLSRN
tara:strand:+ start:1974 stop:3074 length:1101 start_codon:yes stop_codon:yes gene_type:complete